ncbi:MAG TPA: VWA domain-containing protein [Jiangellaceae bacterium]|nr:VWA domain-containing protein [Jiangellaceae bacterium]
MSPDASTEPEPTTSAESGERTVEILIGFTHALRAAGLVVTPDRTQAFVQAVAQAGMEDPDTVFWAGRATLCSGPDDFGPYEATFNAWFSDQSPRPSERTPVERTVVQADLTGDDGGEASGRETLVAKLASDAETLRHRDVAELSPTERGALARLFAALDVRVPNRRSPRRRPSRRGDIDLARTVRDQLRRAGEPGPLRHRRPRARPRRVILLVDISGSMETYADSLLRLAHRVMTRGGRGVEVFTLGTRLTRVTQALRLRDPDAALAAAGQTVPDWSGGTRLGEALRAFLDRWGQRGMARGAVVVIASDGWERGDPTLLGEQVARLHRLAHRVVWANPHRGKEGYAPVQGGIAAALPHVDALVAGHSMAAFEELLEAVGNA